MTNRKQMGKHLSIYQFIEESLFLDKSYTLNAIKNVISKACGVGRRRGARVLTLFARLFSRSSQRGSVAGPDARPEE